MAGVRERLGEALFLRVAGPDGPRHRDRIHGTPGPRWFDGASPIGRVHGDAAMFVGGIRAILLQTLHPAAMAAVAEHSGYRGDMWGRLARTSRFIAVTTFGTTADAEQAVAAVRAIHDRITGVLDDGTPYAASDPHLLLWVHAAEIDSFLLAHQVYGRRPLDQAGRGRVRRADRPGRTPARCGRPADDQGRAPPRSSATSGPSCGRHPRPSTRSSTSAAIPSSPDRCGRRTAS